MIEITLPWPPTVNNYLRFNGRGLCRTVKAQKYLKAVFYQVKKQKINSFENVRIGLHIKAFAPDKKKRDLDNILKMPLDALQYAGVYIDDNQIDKILIERLGVKKKGELVILIEALEHGLSDND